MRFDSKGMVKAEGITGFTKLFRESLADVPDGSLVVFLGSEAVCAPFAQLLAYAVRDRKMSFGFCPKAAWDRCASMVWMDGVGFHITTEKANPAQANVVVVLGGLAIPKFGCPAEDVNSFIAKVIGKPSIIGVCFMDVFRLTGWDKKISFTSLINAYMDAEKII
jgi:hypothetical protein